MPSTSRSHPIDWLLFLALGFMWGSSYFWIKIAVEAGVPPLTLVACRLFFGFLVVGTVVFLARETLPRRPMQYVHLFVMACVNVVIPFTLIPWGAQTIDSALASILNGTVPLFVIVLAPIFLGENVTPAKLAGLVLGFIGVVVLFAPDLVNLGDGDLAGEIALLASSVSYAIGNVYSKRNVKGLRPMIPALFQVGFALLVTTVLALLIEQPIGRVAVPLEALVAMLWIGLLGSGFAYLAYFRLLRDWDATRVSLVAYLLPVVGILLGTFRGEAITLPRVAGTVLIIAGVALVNSRFGQRTLYQREAAGTPRA